MDSAKDLEELKTRLLADLGSVSAASSLQDL